MADFFSYTLRCMCYYQGVQLSQLHQQRDKCTNKKQVHPPIYISTRFISASTIFVSSTNCSTESCSGRFVMMSCA